MLQYGHPGGRLVSLLCRESYTASRMCGKSRIPKGLRSLLHFNRYHHEMAVHLFPLLSGFWSQDGMRILIFDSQSVTRGIPVLANDLSSGSQTSACRITWRPCYNTDCWVQGFRLSMSELSPRICISKFLSEADAADLEPTL